MRTSPFTLTNYASRIIESGNAQCVVVVMGDRMSSGITRQMLLDAYAEGSDIDEDREKILGVFCLCGMLRG